MSVELHPKIETHKNYSQIERARAIAKSLGIPVAARYLRKRNWSIEAATWILLGK